MADTAHYVVKGVIDALKANGAVTAIVGTRIYADVPQGTTFPYIAVSVSTQPFATGSFSGCDHTVKIQVFSRKDGLLEASQARAAAHAVLDRNESGVTLGSGTLSLLQYSGTSAVFKEDDGVTWQAVSEFQALVS